MICPKCNYQRQSNDAAVHAGLCPQCGIAYAKFKAREQVSTADNDSVEQSYTIDSQTSWRRHLFSMVLFVPERVDSLIFYGRAILYGLFVIWGIYFISGGVNWERIGGSFLHNINLPFHEFGHVLFGFFGRFMMILGGSLFQVIMPLICTVAFVWKQKDNFAASITLWWTGQNFIDLSPYIADAPYRGLPLIRGMGEDAHDWGNLLTMTNSLDSAGALAGFSFALGVVIMLLSYAWGGFILWQQKKVIAD